MKEAFRLYRCDEEKERNQNYGKKIVYLRMRYLRPSR